MAHVLTAGGAVVADAPCQATQTRKTIADGDVMQPRAPRTEPKFELLASYSAAPVSRVCQSTRSWWNWLFCAAVPVAHEVAAGMLVLPSMNVACT